MRLFLSATLLVCAGAASPAAAASSFALLKRADVQPSPSIIVFVEPTQAQPTVPSETRLLGELAGPPDMRRPGVTRISASVVAMGEPAVEPTQVSSIADEHKHARNPHLPPMVFRGGLSGEAFVRGSGMPASVAEAARDLAPAAESTAEASEQPQSQQPTSTPAQAAPPPPSPPAGPVRRPE